MTFATDFTDPIAGAGGVDLFLAGSNLYGTPNILGLPAAVIKPQTWLDFHPPSYLRDVVKWIYARDHYTGECATMRKITHYLIRKGVGETLEAYQERVALADYSPHFAHIVDSLAGMLFGVEIDANRVLGAMGDDSDMSTPIGKMWVDADGDRNGYLTIWKLLTTELIAIHDSWIFVDGGAEGANPRIRVLPAEAVTNWRYENGVLVEALIREITDTRESIQDDPKKSAAQYIYLTVDGWQRYQKQQSDVNPTNPGAMSQPGSSTGAREYVVAVGEPGAWAYETVYGEATIPLVPVSLPLRRHVGFMLARKANSIFNKESERDSLLRHCSFPLLNIFAGDTQYRKITDMLKKGSRAIQVQPGGTGHAFIAPSPTPAQELSTSISAKISDLYITGFREYGGASQRSQGNAKSATEVRYDVQTGVAAFLQMLKSAVDDAENAVLFLLEQTFFPDDKSKWGKAHVERSDDFVPFDINEVLERLRTRYFGANVPVPIGRSARIEAAKEIAEWDSLPVDEQEIAADVDASALFTALNTVTLLQPSIPPQAKAEMVIRLLSALGYIDPDNKVVGPDGSPTDELSVDDLRSKALDMATKAQDMQDQQQKATVDQSKAQAENLKNGPPQAPGAPKAPQAPVPGGPTGGFPKKPAVSA